MKPAVNKFIPIFALFTLTLLTLTPMQAFKVVCDNCMEASAGCTDCKRIKAQGPDLSWKIPVESRTPAQSEDRIVGQAQTPEELAGYKRLTVTRRDDNNEKVYSCEDTLPIGSPLRATGIIVMAQNEDQFKNEKWKFARGSIQMIGECHALTAAHAIVTPSTYEYLKPLTSNSSLHDDRLKEQRRIINEGLKNKFKNDAAYRVCIKRKNNSMNFDADQCDKIETVVAMDLSPDRDWAVVRLTRCRGADPTVGHFDLLTPKEMYDYFMKDEKIRSDLPLALTSFAGDRPGCALSVEACSPGKKELGDRVTNMSCNNVAGQSGGALSLVFDKDGNIVSQNQIQQSPGSPNLTFKIIGLSRGTHFAENTSENKTTTDKFYVGEPFTLKSDRDYANNYIEFRRTDINILNRLMSEDYEENKAQIDANIAQMKKQGEVQLAEELKQQKARSRNNYSSANKPSEGI